MAQNLGDVVTIRNFNANNGIVKEMSDSGTTVRQFTSNDLIANESLTLERCIILDSTSGTSFPSYISFEAPKIIIDTFIDSSSYGISIWNNGKNSLTFNNSSVNFDNAVYDEDTDYIGPIGFTGTSSINITSATNGKTIIKASTLTGAVTLDVEAGVQDGTTFNIEAIDNQLVITDGEWKATPSTVGNVTTYTLAKSEPVPVPVIGKYNKKLLRKKLALMLANLKKKRKYFCEVEYLESTGTQWIDSGINVDTSTDEIKLYFQLTETNNYKWFFGEYDTNARLGLGSGDGANKRNFLYQQSATKVSDTQMYNEQHLFEINSNGGFLDGTKIRDYLSFASTSTIYLFNLNIDSPSDYRCKSKIWRYKHKRNGVLIRDMIPVLDWDMRPAMYDKVSGQLFYNQDTGSDFSVGRQIHPVEYLESTGTQYIDTGYIPNTNTYVEMNAMYTSLDSTYRTPFSVRTSDGAANSFTISGATNTSNVYAFGSSYWAEANGCPDADINIKYFLSLKAGVANFNGTTGNAGTTITPTTLTAYMFARNANGTASNFLKGRIYNCLIKESNTIIHDFIPAIDSDGVGYMFDRVSHSIYDNAGTGAFGYPPVEIEYLESTGVEYIDTQYKPNTNTRTVGRCYFNSWIGSNADYVFGVFSSPNNYGLNVGSARQYFNVPWGSNSGISLNGLVPQINKDYEFDISKTGYLIDGQGYGTISSESVDSTRNMYLFWSNGTSASGMNGRIYYLKIYNDGVLARDFIPVFYNGQAGMWDKANEVFYPNVGINAFVAGAIVEPKYE